MLLTFCTKVFQQKVLNTLLAGLNTQVIEDIITLSFRGKIATVFFPIDGVIIPVIFFKELKSSVMQIHFIAFEIL